MPFGTEVFCVWRKTFMVFRQKACSLLRGFSFALPLVLPQIHVLRVAQGHALAREQRRLRDPAGLCLIRCAYAPKLTLLAASTKLGS